MSYIPEPIERLARELNKLPGMGIKTATRLAFHIIDMNNDGVSSLSSRILEAKSDISLCPSCYGYSVNIRELNKIIYIKENCHLKKY